MRRLNSPGERLRPPHWGNWNLPLGHIFGTVDRVEPAAHVAFTHTGVLLFAVLILAFHLVGSALIDHFG